MRKLLVTMLLVVQYQSKTPVGSLRLVVAEVALDLPVPIEARPATRRPAPDPFAGDQWSSDASAKTPSARPRQPTIVVEV